MYISLDIEKHFTLSDPHPDTYFLYSIWHSFWHSSWHLYSVILSGILSGIYSDILSGIVSGKIFWHVFGSRRGPQHPELAEIKITKRRRRKRGRKSFRRRRSCTFVKIERPSPGGKRKGWRSHLRFFESVGFCHQGSCASPRPRLSCSQRSMAGKRRQRRQMGLSQNLEPQNPDFARQHCHKLNILHFETDPKFEAVKSFGICPWYVANN